MSDGSGKGALAAAIDLGTNTVLCTVGRLAADGTLEVLEDRSKMPRLGERLAQGGALHAAAVERTLAVLEDYARRLDELGVAPERRRAVATAVLRRARDAAGFVLAARERAQLSIEILSGEDEARLGYAAVAAAGERTVVVDVGGGSTEVAWDGGRSRASVPVGAVVLTDRCEGDLEDAIRAAREACLGLPEGVAAGGSAAVVAIGGTAVNLACLTAGLARFDAPAADGRQIDAVEALRWARELGACPLEERLRHPVEPGRGEVLPAGLACLGVALERVGATRARVSVRGLRYGVLGEICAGG